MILMSEDQFWQIIETYVRRGLYPRCHMLIIFNQYETSFCGMKCTLLEKKKATYSINRKSLWVTDRTII